MTGREFNFNQWWEAQSVSKPMGSIKCVSERPTKRTWASERHRNPLLTGEHDSSPFRIAPRKFHIAFSPLRQVSLLRAGLSQGACPAWVSTCISFLEMWGTPGKGVCIFLSFFFFFKTASSSTGGNRQRSTAAYREDIVMHSAHHRLKLNFICLHRWQRRPEVGRTMIWFF